MRFQLFSTHNIMTCSVMEIKSLSSEVSEHWYSNLSLLLKSMAGVTICDSREAWYCFLCSMKWFGDDLSTFSSLKFGRLCINITMKFITKSKYARQKNSPRGPRLISHRRRTNCINDPLGLCLYKEKTLWYAKMRKYDYDRIYELKFYHYCWE